MLDLHALPKVRDSLTYLYVEHCVIEQEAKAVAIVDQRGSVQVPCAALNLLLLGPGTKVTHAAMRALAENGCLVEWTGEAGVRLYAHSTGETRSARNLLRQAVLASDPTERLGVIDRMYRMRFAEDLPSGLDLNQLRGREGLRVRAAYARASAETGVEWRGRHYDRGDWRRQDPINRALSAAASALYGICHAAIVATGHSPGLGFIHTGKMLSFVYDVADLYRAELTIPIAFKVVAESTENVDSRARQACRDAFYRSKLLERVVPDIGRVLGGELTEASEYVFEGDGPVPNPGWLWDPTGDIEAGVSHAPRDAAHQVPPPDVGDAED